MHLNYSVTPSGQNGFIEIPDQPAEGYDPQTEHGAAMPATEGSAGCDIIIPFYQTEPGILARALASVFSQTCEDWRLIIVDDGSPSPAEHDLEQLTTLQRSRILLIRTENRGVSAARNTGLQAVSRDARMVAFLDSDDVWDPDHLARAERALSLPGVGIYWAGISGEDFSENYQPVSRALSVLEARPIDTIMHAYMINNLYAVLCGAWWRHMHLSCTVISAAISRQVRFDEGLQFSEDFAFLMECARCETRAVASDAPGAVRGKGANVWHGLSFDDERVAIEKFIMMRLYKRLRRDPHLSDGSRRIIDARIEGRRQQFLWNQLRRLRNGRMPCLSLWSKWVVCDPAITRTVLGRLFGRAPDPGRYVIPLETA